MAADFLSANLKTVIAVSLNASGQVVIGNATDPLKNVGIVLLTKVAYAGDTVDVFKKCEVVEFDRSGPTDVTNAAAVAGTTYFATTGTTGAIDATAPGAGVNKGYIGHTVEAGRLIVDVGIRQG